MGTSLAKHPKQTQGFAPFSNYLRTKKPGQNPERDKSFCCYVADQKIQNSRMLKLFCTLLLNSVSATGFWQVNTQ